MLIFIITEHVGVDGYIASMHARREILTYQLENDVYDNDNVLGKRDLYEQIRDWNEDLAYRQRVQKDFWVGIFLCRHL